MRIDRATFLALALGGGFAVSACGTTGKAKDPSNSAGDPVQVEPTDEYGMPPGPEAGPTYECISWDPVGECVDWEELPADPGYVEE